MKRSEILEAARRCVCGEREQDYGTTGIRSGLSDQNAGAAKRTISGTLDFHAGKLVHGCASDADFL